LKKSKSINRKGRKEFAQRSQRTELQGFVFAYFAPALRTLRLKRTYSKTPWDLDNYTREYTIDKQRLDYFTTISPLNLKSSDDAPIEYLTFPGSRTNF
jgi:hypothetical protein